MTLPAPKHYWNFNETGGTVAADAAGGAMMALDRPSWVPGRVGNAVRFNPSDGVRLATTTLPEMPPPWTAAFWVKREADSQGASLWSSNKHALKLEQWGNTHQVGLTAFGQFDASFDGTAPLNEWAHLAVVGTATETKLYLNGSPHGTLAKSVELGLRWLGSTQGYQEFASAILDEVKVFDQALTDAQVAELATVTGTGLTGQYFTNANLSGTPALTRLDATVNFDWGIGSPDPSIPVDRFSARWTGQVEAERSETYTFTTTSDDGVRLWVNSQLLIDNWTVHSVTDNSGNIALVAGQRYDIKMEFFENDGAATAKLAWSSPSTPRQIVPAARLYPSGSGTRA